MIRPYLYAVALGAAITLVASALLDRIDLANLVMLYLLGVVFAAFRLGKGPGIVLSVLGTAAFDFFLVPPRFSLRIADTQYLLTFAVLLLTALTISQLTSNLRRQAQEASLRERRTRAMYDMTRELGGALTVEQIVDIAERHIGAVFNARVTFFLPYADAYVYVVTDADADANAVPGTPAGGAQGQSGQLRPYRKPSMQPHEAGAANASSTLDDGIAQWVYDHRDAAGSGTKTLPAAPALYLPLNAPMRTRGTLAVVGTQEGDAAVPPVTAMSSDQRQLIDTFASQIALALERVHYVEISQAAEIGIASERLRNSLLSAISHDLRTPLTTIVGFASMLVEREGQAIQTDSTDSRALATAIQQEASRMTSLVTNLLDMARLRDGQVKLDLQWSLPEEAIGAALAACRGTLGERSITVRAPSDLPLVQLDPVLIERVLANLFENASKYAPAGTPLSIAASTVVDDAHRFIKFIVDDAGPGLPFGMEASVFEQFTRGEKESAKPGVGLGLSICKAIVDAHGGRIGAENRIDASTGKVVGARFWFMLPADTAPPDLA